VRRPVISSHARRLPGERRRRSRVGIAFVSSVFLMAFLGGCGGPPPKARFPEYTEDLLLYTIQPGETLYDLAERTYGERSLAWSLAIVNEVADPGRMEPGAMVFMPRDRNILVSMGLDRRDAKRPYNRGTILLEMGRDREAISQLEKALDAAPAVVTPRYHLALAYLREGRVGDAVREMEEVVQRRPLDRDFRYALGCAYLRQGSLKEARREFEQAIRFDAGFAPARFGVALCLQMSGKRKDAMRAWRAYLEMDPDGEWADRANAFLMDLYDGD
jgi:tetratricopeptide (TPR) repeat protein